MSHFTVLVVALDVANNEAAEKVVAKLLAPYSEELAVEPYMDEDGEESTYNPKSKWDWYQIGGRWDSYYGAGNYIRVTDVPDDFDPPFALVLPDGSWQERGRMGWFALVTNEKSRDIWAQEVQTLIAPYRDPRQGAIAVLVDCHI